MKRITKIAAVVAALLLAIPGFAVFQLLDSAAAAGSAPLLYAINETAPVTHVVYADGPDDDPNDPGDDDLASTGGVYAYVTRDSSGSTVIVRAKNTTLFPAPFFARHFDGTLGPKNVTSVDLSRDGTSLVIGFEEGFLHYVSSQGGMLNREEGDAYLTRSPVLDVAIDVSGRFFAAVTFHGDTMLFERERFFEARTVWFHHNPLLAYSLVEREGAISDLMWGEDQHIPKTASEAAGMEGQLPADVALTLRPYTHVEIGGYVSGSSSNPTGLAVIAGDVFGNLYVFNAGDFNGDVAQLTKNPSVVNLVEHNCAPIGGTGRSIPCTADKFARFVEDLPRSAGLGTIQELRAVSNAIRNVAPLDQLVYVFGNPQTHAFEKIVTTKGIGIGAGRTQMIGALTYQSTGPTEARNIHVVQGRYTVGATDATVASHLWTDKIRGPFTDITISEPRRSDNAPLLAASNEDGEVFVYKLAAGSTSTQVLQRYIARDTSDLPIRVNHVSITQGHPETRFGAGTYIAITADDRRIHLVETARTSLDDAGLFQEPLLQYVDFMPLAGATTALDVNDQASVAVGFDGTGGDPGVAIYGGLMTVAIQGAASAQKLVDWDGTAIVQTVDTTPVAYDWSFKHTGTGSLKVGTGLNVSIALDRVGNWDVTLVVTDDLGLTAAATAKINVNPAFPILNISFHTEQIVLEQDEVPDGTDPDDVGWGTATAYVWFNGSFDPDARVGYQPPSGLRDIEITWFAGASVRFANLTNLNASFEYTKDIVGEASSVTVTARAIDEDENSVSASFQIQIHQEPGLKVCADNSMIPLEEECPQILNDPPTAAFDAFVDDLNVTVDGSDSSDSDGTIVLYTWDFGDGGSGSGINTTHTYATPGEYQIELTVEDDDGATDTTSKLVIVGDFNRRPVALFTVKVVDFNASFNASASYDPDGDPITYAWDFGDGNTSTGKFTNHTYGTEGNFTVTLTVTDDQGNSGSATKKVKVKNGTTTIDDNLPPTADFDFDTHNLKVTFDGSLSSDPENDTLTYAWTFGDTQTGTGVGPIHTYALAGTYTVTLTVDDGNGGTSSISKPVKVMKGAANDGFPGAGPARLHSIYKADEDGRSVSIGGDMTQETDGRFVLRNHQGYRVYHFGLRNGSALDAAFTTGAIKDDGSRFIMGLTDGTAWSVEWSNPDTRRAQRQIAPAGDAIIGAAFNEREGQAVFISEGGNITVTRDDLGGILYTTDVTGVGVRLVDFVATDNFRQIVVATSDNRLLLLDGRNVTEGVKDSQALTGTFESLTLTGDRGKHGARHVLAGLSNGGVDVFRIVGDQFFDFGRIDIDDQSARVIEVLVSHHGNDGHFAFIAVTRTAGACTPTAKDCGKLVYVDTRTAQPNQLPEVSKEAGLEFRPEWLEVTPDFRHYLVGSATERIMHKYDTLWRLGPLDRIPTGALRPDDADMDDHGATHVLLQNETSENLYWVFAPPTAHLEIQKFDDDGHGPWKARHMHIKDTIYFNASMSTPGDGTLGAVSWSLGDGTVKAGTIVTHMYDNKLDCFYTNGAASEEYKCHIIVIVEANVTLPSSTGAPFVTKLRDRWEVLAPLHNPAPVAILSTSHFDTGTGKVIVYTGTKVKFDASASYDPDPDGRITRYQFTFGDGDGLGTIYDTAKHAYARPGTYLANVTVLDKDGFLDISDTFVVEVLNRAPTAKFVYWQQDGNETNGRVTAGLPVKFDATISTDPDGHVVAYEWEFDDGTTPVPSTDPKPTFTPSAATNVTVSLRVKDNAGEWSPYKIVTIMADDAIRLEQIHKKSDKRYLNPAQLIWVDGFVQDMVGFPGPGTPIAGADIIARIYYDGPYNSTRAEDPYDTTTITTNSTGKARYDVPQNDAGAAYLPGRYRLEMTAVWESSFNPSTGSMGGDTEYSAVTETVFFVEGSV